jgi:hypothetical protein
MSYHYNLDIGLTVWNSTEKYYYLIPFANVRSYFQKLSEVLVVPEQLIDNCYNFMSDYNPNHEAVLLTLNEDLLTVAVISKDQRASREAVAEQLGWSLSKLTAFVYLFEEAKVDNNTLCDLFKLQDEEFDKALEFILA